MTLVFGKEKKVTLSGVVLDVNGEPAKKVIIQLYDHSGDEIKDEKTNRKGQFKFKKVVSGEYSLTASHKTLGKTNKAITVGDEDLDINLTLSLLDETNATEDSISNSESPNIDSSKEESEIKEPSLLSHLQKPNDPLNDAKPDSIVYLPPVRKDPGVEKLAMGDMFYDYKMNLEAMQNQIDSLKSVVTAFEEKQTMPNVSDDILNLIKIPDYEHRIELQNGTVVMGKILAESDSSLTIDTQIGKLVLKKEMVIRMDELEQPAPNVEFLNEPTVNVYPDKYIFTGQIQNTGKIRADFVRVIAHLWTQTTSSAGMDSSFVKGTKIKYETGVVSDTALEPDHISTYKVIVPITYGTKPQYHTMDIHWDITK